MGVRLALLAALALSSLAVAAPATANELAGDHLDGRAGLAFTGVAETVETVDRAADTEGQGLPLTWCGDERTADDLVHARNDPALPQFKLVYAYASDRTNRFAAWKDALQADVSLISRFMGAQSGGRKAPRFDMGTSCGPEYVDVQVVALPGPRALYASQPDVLKSAVGAQVTGAAGPRNTLVLADQLSDEPAGNWTGVGESYVSQAKAGTPHNAGGLFAALWVPDAEAAPGADPDGWWAEGMLHELTHNLGAVGDDAPHASGYGHCWDGYDVMCYRDGPAPRQAMAYPCPRLPNVMSQVYDCGGDDYFNVAPAAGTYLGDHWNVYDNRFLAACVDSAPACGGTAVPGTNPQPPVSTSQPLVAGDARVGAVLTATAGGWANAPASFSYSWEQGDGATWLAVPGATGPTHAVTADDAGLRLRVRVIAANGDGATAAYSAPTGYVADPAAAVPAPPSTAPIRGRAPLRIARGRGRGRRLGTIEFRLADGRLRAAPARVRLARGRYRLRLCSTAGGTRCARRTLTVARTSVARLPALSIGVPAGAAGRVSYTLRATRGVFSALTAKRPGAGLLLGP